MLIVPLSTLTSRINVAGELECLLMVMQHCVRLCVDAYCWMVLLVLKQLWLVVCWNGRLLMCRLLCSHRHQSDSRSRCHWMVVAAQLQVESVCCLTVISRAVQRRRRTHQWCLAYGSFSAAWCLSAAVASVRCTSQCCLAAVIAAALCHHCFAVASVVCC